MRQFMLAVAGIAVLLASVATASSAGEPQAQPRWVITDLGTLGRGSSDSYATAINHRGQIVEMSLTGQGLFVDEGRAFLSENVAFAARNGDPRGWS